MEKRKVNPQEKPNFFIEIMDDPLLDSNQIKINVGRIVEGMQFQTSYALSRELIGISKKEFYKLKNILNDIFRTSTLELDNFIKRRLNGK